MGLYTPGMQQFAQQVDNLLQQYLPQPGGPADILARAMRYACEGGGKRIRPVLLMEFCRVCGGDAEKALPFACALEMVHSYSLVHDDLPCMDNSPMRRGKPSVHAAFGEDMALLAGDGLLNRAFEVMLNPANWSDLPADAVLAAAFELARAAGYEGMVGGQALDLLSEGQAISLERLEQLQFGKTAALFIAACKMGCYLSGQPNERWLAAAETYGRELGLCFQVIDDILDVTATAEQIGKPVGSDADLQKSTYTGMLGVEGARQLAADRTRAAIAALEVFSEQADGLRQLAATLLQREK